jgi:thymidylate kinase
VNPVTKFIAASSRPPRKVLWVSVDGVECAGKTSLCARLETAVPGSQLLPEFSPSPVGLYLQRSVESSPHFISRSILGQSLLFLADYAEIAQSTMMIDDPAIKVVFQDRGFLSKFVYQLVVLQDGMGEQRARKLLSVIMDELPRPDVTVFLDAPMSVIESRLRLARPTWLTPERRIFVERAAGAFRDEIGSLDGVILHLYQRSVDTIDNILSITLGELEQLLPEGDTPSGSEKTGGTSF